MAEHLDGEVGHGGGQLPIVLGEAGRVWIPLGYLVEQLQDHLQPWSDRERGGQERMPAALERLNLDAAGVLFQVGQAQGRCKLATLLARE